jgi:hypothetical protein
MRTMVPFGDILIHIIPYSPFDKGG